MKVIIIIINIIINNYYFYNYNANKNDNNNYSCSYTKVIMTIYNISQSILMVTNKIVFFQQKR